MDKRIIRNLILVILVTLLQSCIGNGTRKVVKEAVVYEECPKTNYYEEDDLTQITIEEAEPKKLEYNAVDLGLPSGTLWADRNVGACEDTDYGDYFAWGETSPKQNNNWENYKFGDYYNELTKYCYKSSYGYNGFCDNLRQLEIIDDAASINMGEEWRTPTHEDFEELIAVCTCEFFEAKNSNLTEGLILTGPNGNSIFMPAAGRKHGDSIERISFGDYWSSTLSSDSPCVALSFTFESWSRSRLTLSASDGNTRCFAMPIRAILSNKKKRNGYRAIDLGLPSGTLWADKNIGAESALSAGTYFAWGETSQKSEYSRDNYKPSSEDIATSIMGKGWHTPTQEQFEELLRECSVQQLNYGFKIVGPNGNCIFLPETGYYDREYLYGKYDGYYGYYWTNTYAGSTYDEKCTSLYRCLEYNNTFGFQLKISTQDCYKGIPVRAVKQ